MRTSFVSLFGFLAVLTPFVASADDAKPTGDAKPTSDATAKVEAEGTVTIAGADGKPLSATDKTSTNSPSQRFGVKGQYAFSSDAALTIQSSSTSDVPGSTTTISLHPAMDYFLAQNFSLGGFLGLDYTKAGEDHSTRLSIGPRVGYDFALSDLVSIWPKIGFAVASTSTTFVTQVSPTTSVSSTASATNVSINLFVPVMFHPVPHFFAGFGPFLDTDVSGDKKTTLYGGKLTLGGWI